VLPGAQLLRNFYLSRNETARASYWQQKYLERAGVLQAAKEERGKLLLSDQLGGHQLPADALEALTAQLRVIPELTRAYLVRKAVRHLPESPVYVLGFKVTRWWQIRNAADSHAVTQRIRQEVEFPGSALIVNIEGSNRRFAKKIRRVRGSRIL
jgi:hypothetical protein